MNGGVCNEEHYRSVGRHYCINNNNHLVHDQNTRMNDRGRDDKVHGQVRILIMIFHWVMTSKMPTNATYSQASEMQIPVMVANYVKCSDLHDHISRSENISTWWWVVNTTRNSIFSLFQFQWQTQIIPDSISLRFIGEVDDEPAPGRKGIPLSQCLQGHATDWLLLFVAIRTYLVLLGFFRFFGTVWGGVRGRRHSLRLEAAHWSKETEKRAFQAEQQEMKLK